MDDALSPAPAAELILPARAAGPEGPCDRGSDEACRTPSGNPYRLLESLSDQALASGAGSGDRVAFEALCIRWWDRIRGFCASMCAFDPDISAEAAQESLLRLYTAAGRYRGDAAFGTFLYRLCRNATVDVVRRRKRERRHLSPLPGDGESPVDPGPDPGRFLERSCEVEALRKLLGELAPEDRAMLYLRDVEDVPVAGLARIFGIPEGTVKSRLSRCRSRLAASFKEEFDVFVRS